MTAPQASRTPTSLGTLLQLPVAQPMLVEWRDSHHQDDFQSRIAANYQLPWRPRPESLISYPASSAPSLPASFCSSSRGSSVASMPAQNTRQRSSAGCATPSSARLPSLESDRESTAESSIRTDLTGDEPLPGSLPLADVDGVLQAPNPRACLECAFWFLDCKLAFDDETQWRIHCLSHFRRSPPPRSVRCPLCPLFRAQFDDGYVAWDARMDHVLEHHQLGHTLQHSQPDFDLFHYLWQKGIICNGELQELKGNYLLNNPPRSYTVTGGRSREERNRRPRRTYFRPS